MLQEQKPLLQGEKREMRVSQKVPQQSKVKQRNMLITRALKKAQYQKPNNFISVLYLFYYFLCSVV